MDLSKMIGELQAERAQVNEAIVALERLGAATIGKRRGRPPAWISELRTNVPKRKGRPPGSKNKPKEKEQVG